MSLLCKWDAARQRYVFPGADDPVPSQVNLPGLRSNLLSRAEIGETLSRLGVNPHPEQPEQNVGEQEIGEGHVEGDVDIGDGEMEEEEEEEAATHQHQPFRVTPLMIAVAEREAQGWRAIADALKALMVQQQSNPQ